MKLKYINFNLSLLIMIIFNILTNPLLYFWLAFKCEKCKSIEEGRRRSSNICMSVYTSTQVNIYYTTMWMCVCPVYISSECGRTEWHWQFFLTFHPENCYTALIYNVISSLCVNNYHFWMLSSYLSVNFLVASCQM